MKKLDQYTMMTAIPSDEKVYKCNIAEERDKMNAVTSCPRRSGTLKTKRNEYFVFESKEEAEAHVLNGGSILIEGIAGTGKSYFARGMVERLRSLGKKGNSYFENAYRQQPDRRHNSRSVGEALHTRWDSSDRLPMDRRNRTARYWTVGADC